MAGLDHICTPLMAVARMSEAFPVDWLGEFEATLAAEDELLLDTGTPACASFRMHLGAPTFAPLPAGGGSSDGEFAELTDPSPPPARDADVAGSSLDAMAREAIDRTVGHVKAVWEHRAWNPRWDGKAVRGMIRRAEKSTEDMSGPHVILARTGPLDAKLKRQAGSGSSEGASTAELYRSLAVVQESTESLRASVGPDGVLGLDFFPVPADRPPEPLSADDPDLQCALARLPNLGIARATLSTEFATARGKFLAALDAPHRVEERNRGARAVPQLAEAERIPWRAAAAAGLSGMPASIVPPGAFAAGAPLLQVAVYAPARYRLEQELLLSPDCTLADLRDRIVCLQDTTGLLSGPHGPELEALEVGAAASGDEGESSARLLATRRRELLLGEPGYFFIEGVLYDDTRCRHCTGTGDMAAASCPLGECPPTLRLSSKVCTWAHAALNKGVSLGWGPLVPGDMLQQRAGELVVRLGAHYAYVHHGGSCVHLLVFNDLRLASGAAGADKGVESPACYPRLVSTAAHVIKRCSACLSSPTSLLAFGDAFAETSPASYCLSCWRQLYEDDAAAEREGVRVVPYVHDP